jgi:hypothetical protein
VANLEHSAKDLEKNSADAAHTAIAATILFLQAVNAPRHLLAPFEEAAWIIQEKMGVGVPSSIVKRVYQSVAVHFQIECKIPELEALKSVVGRSPSAIRALKNFRGNMMSKNSPKGARAFYYEVLPRMSKGFSPEERMSRALAICQRMRGKKS